MLLLLSVFSAWAMDHVAWCIEADDNDAFLYCRRSVVLHTVFISMYLDEPTLRLAMLIGLGESEEEKARTMELAAEETDPDRWAKLVYEIRPEPGRKMHRALLGSENRLTRGFGLDLAKEYPVPRRWIRALMTDPDDAVRHDAIQQISPRWSGERLLAAYDAEGDDYVRREWFRQMTLVDDVDIDEIDKRLAEAEQQCSMIGAAADANPAWALPWIQRVYDRGEHASCFEISMGDNCERLVETLELAPDGDACEQLFAR